MKLFSHFRQAPDPAPAREGEKDPPGVDYRALLEGSLDMICLAELMRDGRRRFLYASPSAEEVIGWNSVELLRMAPADIYTPASIIAIGQEIARLRGGGTSRVELEAIRKDGQHIWVENRVRVLDRNDKRMLLVICTRDVTERRMLEERLEHQAMVDGLTGIENRRAFDRALEREWKRTLRDGVSLSVVLLDVDHFKAFNDTYGHLAGDDCLREIATTVKGTVKRPGDVVARFGGEELAVLLPATDLAAAEMVATRCREAVAALLIPHCGNADGMGMVTLSGGVSAAVPTSINDAQMPQGLLLAADAALYRAKQNGRNCVQSLATGEAVPRPGTAALLLTR